MENINLTEASKRSFLEQMISTVRNRIFVQTYLVKHVQIFEKFAYPIHPTCIVDIYMRMVEQDDGKKRHKFSIGE